MRINYRIGGRTNTLSARLSANLTILGLAAFPPPKIVWWVSNDIVPLLEEMAVMSTSWAGTGTEIIDCVIEPPINVIL